VHVELIETRDEFAQRAGELLRARVEHNVLATVVETAARDASDGALYALVEDDAGELIGAGLRLPPHPMLASSMSSEAADALIGALIAADRKVSGVVGPETVARSIAASWERRTSGTARLRIAQALHSLEHVTGPARPAPGTLRVPRPEERELILRWADEFAIEAGVTVDAEGMVGRRLERGLVHIWDDNGAVSLVCSSPTIAGAARIGPVYTPPELRGRGYASHAVAVRSEQLLDGGAQHCLLYTDLANPTSNRIYAALGYQRIAAWEEWALD
jgi:predicted GNAT family acetyltransferase